MQNIAKRNIHVLASQCRKISFMSFLEVQKRLTISQAAFFCLTFFLLNKKHFPDSFFSAQSTQWLLVVSIDIHMYVERQKIGSKQTFLCSFENLRIIKIRD